MPSKKQLRLKVHRQKETGSVDDASLLYQTEVLLEKVARKVLRRIEKGHQRAVFAPVGDQTGTGARGVGIIGEVGHQDAVLLRLGAHLLGKVIVADGAEDGGHSRLTEEPLGHSNGVLHCPTGDHLHRVVGSHVLHQCPVLLFRSDHIVWLKIVFAQKFFVHIGAQVEQWTAQTEDVRFTSKG